MDNNPYLQALESGRANDTLAQGLESLANEPLEAPEHAAVIADFVAREQEWLAEPEAAPTRLRPILGLFQQVESAAAFEALRDSGLPVLRDVHDAWQAREPWDNAWNEDFLFLIKILALFAQPEDLPRLASAARDERLADEPLWAPIFAAYHADHPLYDALFEELTDPLPGGLAGICLLDAANERAREGADSHPFNHPAGHARLEVFLRDSDKSDYAKAHSAAAALPFMDDPPRGQLLALGLDHQDERVQLEAAWASASLGSRAGVEFLARACLDWRQSAVAVEYLTELEELNVIPARAMDPEFAALAQMARWLAHPMEFGRPPDEVALLDRRVLNWPPAGGQPRDLALVRYRYRGQDAADEGELGVGLVGGITFSLFGETDTRMPPEEVYALHCCFEMQIEELDGAPPERTVSAGRQLLQQAGNPGF